MAGVGSASSAGAAGSEGGPSARPGASALLPASRREALQTYLSVTETTDESSAIAILDSADWDVERALDTYLRENAPENTTNSEQERTVTSPAPSSPPVPAPPPQPLRGLRALWVAAVVAPLRSFWSFFRRAGALILRLLGGHARALATAPGRTHAERFKSFYESRHGTEHPLFFAGPYLAALAAAQRDVRLLLVYLHSESHAATAAFCRDILANHEFRLAADTNFIFWAGSVAAPDAAAAQHALRAPGFPFLGIVAPPRATVRVGTETPALSSAHFGTLLSCRSGHGASSGGAQGAINWMNAVAARHAPALAAVRAERVSRETNRLLIEQQNREYAESLQADKERERREREERERVEAEEREKVERELRRERKREALGEEPEKGPGICSVVLRLPDGTRVERRFSKDGVLENVFDWAEVHRVDIEVACLVTTFPRKSWRYPEDGDVSLEAAGLYPSAMLLLEERVDDE